MQENPGARPPLRVLVVDDLEVNRRLALLLLRSLGCEAETAASGREACEMAMRLPYDLIFMDVQMPGMDGLEATRILRTHYGDEGPRIVAMTANAIEGNLEQCLAAGMHDFIAKPLSPQALRAIIERATVRAAVASNPFAIEAARPDTRLILDWSRLGGLKPYDDDGSLVRDVIAAFLRDGPAQAKALAAAHAAGDSAGVASLAHGLKGASVNVGAVALHAICRAIESRAAAGERDPAASALTQLARCMDATCTALRAGPP